MFRVKPPSTARKSTSQTPVMAGKAKVYPCGKYETLWSISVSEAVGRKKNINNVTKGHEFAAARV